MFWACYPCSPVLFFSYDEHRDGLMEESSIEAEALSLRVRDLRVQWLHVLVKLTTEQARTFYNSMALIDEIIAMETLLSDDEQADELRYQYTLDIERLLTEMVQRGSSLIES